MSHLDDVEEALEQCSIALAAIGVCAEHYDFGDLPFRFEDRPSMTIRQVIDRTMELVRPVNVAIDHRQGHAVGVDGCLKCRSLVLETES